MFPASRAELAQFHTVGIVFLVFLGGIVATLAGRASQRDHNAIFFAFSHDFLRFVAWLAEDALGSYSNTQRHSRD
jgi:hypothetical protein